MPYTVADAFATRHSQPHPVLRCQHTTVCYHAAVRALGIDYGLRRIGLAVSDATGMLARPLTTLARAAGETDSHAIDAVFEAIADLERDGEVISTIVIGLPRRLDGTANDQTPLVQAFAATMAARTPVPVVLQDERLSSHEAEARLARREKDWRKRKAQLDAASAAVILQDYLDSRGSFTPDDTDAY